MKTQKLYRGRLLDHLQLVVRDLSVSKRFYQAIFSTLGVEIGGEGQDYFWADELFISTKESPAAQGQLTGRVHLAFQAPSREVVQQFYQAGIEAGGVANGDPGERPYHPGYYAAFLIDPDGNNVEAVFHGPAKRSTPAIEITF
ncbi:MAG TPA: VOC family protein [Polyangiaceae bacterium]|nr:VOC family protein [Polyangiaceae bacterium]